MLVRVLLNVRSLSGMLSFLHYYRHFLKKKQSQQQNNTYCSFSFFVKLTLYGLFVSLFYSCGANCNNNNNNNNELGT